MNGPGRALIIVGLILWQPDADLLRSKTPHLARQTAGRHTFKRGNFSFYFPLATCLLLSAILSFIIWLFREIDNKKARVATGFFVALLSMSIRHG